MSYTAPPSIPTISGRAKALTGRAIVPGDKSISHRSMMFGGLASGQTRVTGLLEGEELFHASLAPTEYRALFASCDLAVIAHRIEDPECGGMTVWLVGKV